MAIPIANLNPLPPPTPPAATPSTAPTGLFQATLANAAVQQISTPPLLTYLEDTGQLEAIQQEDYPQSTATTNATTTNTANQANNSPSLAAQLGDATTTSNVNENGTTAAELVVRYRFPGLISQNLAGLAGPTSGTSTVPPGTTTATAAAGNQTLTEQLRLQVAGTTRSGTTEVGTTTAQTVGSQIAPAAPTVPPAVATPASTQPATAGVPIPPAASYATGSATNPTTAAILASQQQVIPAQIPIVAGLATATQPPTPLVLATPEAVAAPVATAPLPSAQTGERPVMAGDRLAMIAQEGANLRPAQVQSSTTFQSLLAQAVPGTGAAQSPTGTTPVTGGSTGIVATAASLTALSAQPSVSVLAASTGPAPPTSSVPLTGEVGGPQITGSALQLPTVGVGGLQHEGLFTAITAPEAALTTAQISTSPSNNAAGAATAQVTNFTTGTTQPPAGPAPTSPNTPTLATQLADGVISHAQVLNQSGTTEFRMRLDPPELGPVNVHLVSTGDEVRGHVVVTSDSVRQMIESQLPELRQRLEAAGVTVQNFNVTTDPSGGGNRNARQEPTPETPTPLLTAPSTTATTRFRTNTIPRSGQVDVVV